MTYIFVFVYFSLVSCLRKQINSTVYPARNSTVQVIAQNTTTEQLHLRQTLPTLSPLHRTITGVINACSRPGYKKH
jgi:hypothetical protein